MRKHLFGNYFVDSDGYVINQRTNQIVKPSFHKQKGYYRVVLLQTNPRMTINHALHTLIIKSFVDSDYNHKLDSITFIDGDKKNCKLENLRLIKSTRINDDQILSFVNSIDLYRITRGIFSNYKKSKCIASLSSVVYTHEDIIQDLVTYLHKYIPYYLAKYQTQDFFLWARNKLFSYLDYSLFHQILLGKSIQTTMYDMSDDFDMFVSKSEAYNCGIFESLN